MLKMGILGVGNAGNQVVASAHTMQAPVTYYALNCSEQDLNTIPDGIPKRLIGDGRGSGKNRDESKASLASSISEVLKNEDMQAFIKPLDILFIASSTGGGTGSGISLLLTKVMKNVFPTVFVIPIGILPAIKEGESTHANTLEYLGELYNVLESPTYMLYDNEKLKMPTPLMMESVNTRIVNDITLLCGFYNTSTKYASMDDKDMLNLIKTPGRIVIAAVQDFKEKDLDDGSVEQLLLADLKSSPHVDIQSDRIVNRVGVIASINKYISEKFDTSGRGVESEIGSPIENFEHLSINDDRKLPNNVFMILTGCTKINDRIHRINERIEQIEEDRKKMEDDDALNVYNGTEINAARSYTRNKPGNEKIDLAGIFGDFNVKLP